MTTIDDWQEYGRFRDAIAQVMDARFYTPEWLDGEIWSGRARIFSSADAAIIATMKVYPAGGREVHGLVAVGDLEQVTRLIPQAETWGRTLGCIVAGIDSREGWAKVMKNDGYAVHQVALRKDL